MASKYVNMTSPLALGLGLTIKSYPDLMSPPYRQDIQIKVNELPTVSAMKNYVILVAQSQVW